MNTDRQPGSTVLDDRADVVKPLRTVAIFTSCDSFEGFYGGTFGIDRETYLKSYRNDFVWEYAQGLRSCGHDVFIYILSYGPPELKSISDRLSVRFLPLPRWLRFVDAVLWRLRFLKRIAWLRDRVAYQGYGAALQAALERDEVHVIYHQEIWTPRFDIVVSKTAVPVIGADQGAVYAEWMAPAKRQSLQKAAGLICQSTIALDRTHKLGATAELIYNGVDISFFAPPPPSFTRPRSILAVGRLVEEQKRFSDLLNAMLLLPDFTLTLVGSGPDEGKLKKLVMDLGLEQRVNFAGFVGDRAKLLHLYRGSGVFVSTSAWEAVALVVLEAMSCGTPVVATRIPSFEDLLTDKKDGLLVPVGAPERVAQAVRTAYLNKDEIGTNGRQTVIDRYSSAALYSRLSNLVQTI